MCTDIYIGKASSKFTLCLEKERGCLYLLKLVPTVLEMDHNDVKS